VVASAAPPALVLMDMALPDGDGMQLLTHLRAVEGWAPCVVVALTAHALVGDADRFMAAGFDAVLTKPIDTRSFVANVERWAAAGRRSTPAR
jgi:CheY-like chemotaxis protein